MNAKKLRKIEIAFHGAVPTIAPRNESFVIFKKIIVRFRVKPCLFLK